MIIEAFSQLLQTPENRGIVPERVLHEWLSNTLLVPPHPQDNVARIIHAEIELIDEHGNFSFEGKSESGNRLLVTLFNYCRSYDNWQFTRWLHHVNASDFFVDR